MNTTIEHLSARIHELLSERDYLRRSGESSSQLERVIGQLQLSRAVLVAHVRYGAA